MFIYIQTIWLSHARLNHYKALEVKYDFSYVFMWDSCWCSWVPLWYGSMSLITRFMGPTWGPSGAPWAPCWSHQSCYLGWHQMPFCPAVTQIRHLSDEDTRTNTYMHTYMLTYYVNIDLLLYGYSFAVDIPNNLPSKASIWLSVVLIL